MQSSRVWSAKRDTLGPWFGNPRTPVGVGRGCFRSQGLRASRLTPGYVPCTAPRCY